MRRALETALWASVAVFALSACRSGFDPVAVVPERDAASDVPVDAADAADAADAPLDSTIAPAPRSRVNLVVRGENIDALFPRTHVFVVDPDTQRVLALDATDVVDGAFELMFWGALELGRTYWVDGYHDTSVPGSPCTGRSLAECPFACQVENMDQPFRAVLTVDTDEDVTVVTGAHVRAQCGVEPIPGDANLDGCVDERDGDIWFTNIGRLGVVPGDFDRDGVVGSLESLTQLQFNGEGCS